MNSLNSHNFPGDSSVSEIPSEIEATKESLNSMAEYYQLKRSVFLTTLALIGVISPLVWISTSANTAFNYVVGASVGLVYLRMLAKDVEKLGPEQKRAGSGRLAVFIAVIVLATRVNQLSVLPVFLGFLTYKLAIIGYVLLTSLTSLSSQSADYSQ